MGGLSNQGPVIGIPHTGSPSGKDYQMYKSSEETDETEESMEEDGSEPMNAQKLLDKNTKYPCGQSPISPGISDDYLPQYSDDGDEISGGRMAEPNVFPWLLRLCHKEKNGTEYFCNCGATLITAIHALTSFYCVTSDESPCEIPDLSEGNVFVIPGTNLVEYQGSMESVAKEHYVVKEVLAPENVGTRKECKNGDEGHQFAMLLFKKRVSLRVEVRPICLPPPGLRRISPGMRAVAAGWGMQAEDNGVKGHWSGRQSRLLKRVTLTVSEDEAKRSKYQFGTTVEFKRGEYQDPCSGDGGGPLMTYDYEDPNQHGNNGRAKWYIIGTLHGGGYDCRDGSGGDSDGLWNKVSAHIKWIKETIKGQGSDYVAHRMAKMTGQTSATGQKDYVAHRN